MGTRRLGLIFIISIALAFFAGFQIKTFFDDNEVQQVTNLYDEITAYLDTYYLYDLDDKEKEQAFIDEIEAIVASYAASNDDPYTRLSVYDQNYIPRSDESYVGIGITVTQEGSVFRITDINPNGPSYQKLYPNDIVIGVSQDGEVIDFRDLMETEAQSYLSGTVNETKSLVVLHPDGVESIIDVTYEEILTPTAYSYTLSEDVGYIKITEFSAFNQDVTEGTAKIFNDVLRLLETEVLKDESDTLILDLRDNPGGALSALHNMDITSLLPGITQQLLIKDIVNPLFTMVNSQNDMDYYHGGLTQAKAYDIKVLVNENSASAAEVLAASLYQSGGYDLYGMPTYGKDVYQNTVFMTTINDLSYYLTYTEGHWYYDMDLSVKDDPLPVIEIEQLGYNAIKSLTFEDEISLDTVDLTLIPYQHFLNTYYALSGNDMIRTDGYFDQKTFDYVTLYQTENQLTANGILDLNTARLMYDQLLIYQTMLDYDVQLQTLLGLIG